MILSSVLLSSCGGGSSSGASNAGADGSVTVDASDEIFLNAFSDFACSPGWANRNGALGRVAYSGSGTCDTPFPGESGVYAVYLQAQAEADGSSPYAVSLDGETVQQSAIPYAYGTPQCGCSFDECPDQIVNLGVGIFEIDTGDVIQYYGEDIYPCGEHGSYAKWQGLIFERQ